MTKVSQPMSSLLDMKIEDLAEMLHESRRKTHSPDLSKWSETDEKHREALRREAWWLLHDNRVTVN